MGVNRSNGITYNMHGSTYGNRSQVPSAWEHTKRQYEGLGLDFNYGLDTPSQYVEYDHDQVWDNLYLDEREQYAGDMFQLFDLYKPQMEYVAENAGVSGAELSSQLGESGARFNANYDAMTAEADRDLKRMGVNPNSGRYAAMATGNALGKAAGFSLNQNQVNQEAKAQDMGERLQAAQLGFNVGSQATNTYNQMGAQLQSAQQFYDQMGEQSRQFNTSAKMQTNNQKLQKQNQMYGEAQGRYMNGLQTNYTKNGFGKIDSVNYKFGF